MYDADDFVVKVAGQQGACEAFGKMVNVSDNVAYFAAKELL